MMSIYDPTNITEYSSGGFRKVSVYQGLDGARRKIAVTEEEMEDFVSMVTGWLRQQEELGRAPDRENFRRFIEGIREQKLSDAEFKLFLEYFEDWYEITI